MMNEETQAPQGSDEAKPGTGAGPVAGKERIESIDKLRGIAVAGILVMNIYGFAMPFTAYANPLAYGGNEWYNLGTWHFTHILFDQKFLPIFSMLFGGGLVMMAGNAAAKGVKFASTWYRRNFWLIVIGAAHAYLLWFGDILFAYAVIGMLIYPLHKLKPRTLTIVACVLLSAGLLISVGGGKYMIKLQTSSAEIIALQEAGEELSDEQTAMLEEWEAMSAFLGPPEEAVRKDLEGYRQGYADVVVHRAPIAVMMQTSVLSFLIWRVGGLMILGMALMKLGVFSGERSKSFYKKLLLAGYGLGFPLVLYSAYDLSAHQFDALYMFKLGGMWNYVGSVLVSLGHISAFMLIILSGALGKLMQRFAALGRMALTNYLMHSVILTTAFYGYGLGLYGAVPRFWQMGIVVAVVLCQLWYSPLWLDKYRFGPVEWFWRSLTYWQRQPMVRKLA